MLDFINVCTDFMSDLFSFDFFRYPLYIMFVCGVLFLLLYIIRGRVNG